MELSEQLLRNDEIETLTRALLGGCQEVRILCLHKNQISSDGAHAIAHFLEQVEYPPQELHLSHNWLGPDDARRLFVAAASRCEYPLKKRYPLWLRLEMQQDPDLWGDIFQLNEWRRWDRMQEMVAYAEEKLRYIRHLKGIPLPRKNNTFICLVKKTKGCSRCCNNTVCWHAMPNDGTGPILHLPYIWHQGLAIGNKNKTSQTWVSSCVRRRWTVCGFKREPTTLYESKDIMVLSKGPHWICAYNSHQRHIDLTRQNIFRDKRSSEEIVTSPDEEHLDHFLAKRYNDEMAQNWPEANDGAGCMHRLEKDTSGCLLRAKTQKGWDQLSQQLQQGSPGRIEKAYICLVYGRIPAKNDSGGLIPEMKITMPISSDGQESWVDEDNGEAAETFVKCLAHYQNDVGREYSLCQVRLLTERTHQIRVHMAYKHNYIVSDPRYNPLIVFNDTKWCKRMFLHAAYVTFWDDGEQKCCQSPLDNDLLEALSHLRLKEDFSQTGLDQHLTIPAAPDLQAMRLSSSQASSTVPRRGDAQR